MNTNSGDVTSTERDFFIPDLCAPRSVLILFLLAELLVLVFALLSSELPRFDANSLATVSFFVQWIVLLCAAILCASRRFLSQLSLQLGVLVSFLIMLVVTLFTSLVAREIFPSATHGEYSNWWILRNLLVTLVIGGIVLRYFYLQQELLSREQAELTARLESLRARIRPHFLFNTMNSIASLIGSRPEDAEQVVEDLSELFRASLTENEQGATLGDELHLCRLYLRIEQLRLGERLQVHWQADPDLEEEAMPALMMQPLVENAVYHGIARLAEGGTIDIKVSSNKGQLQVEVRNPVPDHDQPREGGHQIALDNIQQRLFALFDERARFEAGRTAQGYRVFFSYPLQGEP